MNIALMDRRVLLALILFAVVAATVLTTLLLTGTLSTGDSGADSTLWGRRWTIDVLS